MPFPEELRKQLERCSVVVALIGPAWLEPAEKTGKPKIWDPRDWVRQEFAIASALNRKVIPVLLDKARMPTVDDLPQPVPRELDRFLKLNALPLPDSYWREGVIKLVEAMGGTHEVQEARRH